MIKSRTIVDTDEVKRINNEAKDWTGTCRICKQVLTGTLADIKKHMEQCHGE
jgi:hypothetical protein